MSQNPPPRDGPSETELTDGSLLRRFRAGEADAATQLYLRYARRLSHLARAQTPASLGTRIDPEDVVQSVFRTFFRRVAVGHYNIPEGEDLWKLLLVISLNKIRALGTFHRAAKRDVGNTTELNEQATISRGLTPDESALRLLELTIDELLAELPASHAPIIRLRIEGHEVAEIAERVSRSKRTVERILQSFRERLSTIVHEELPGIEDGPRDPGGTG